MSTFESAKGFVVNAIMDGDRKICVNYGLLILEDIAKMRTLLEENRYTQTEYNAENHMAIFEEVA